MKEQEIVSRIIAGLLENYYEFFENEEEDFSSNDLSSITEQVSIFNIPFLKKYKFDMNLHRIYFLN